MSEPTVEAIEYEPPKKKEAESTTLREQIENALEAQEERVLENVAEMLAEATKPVRNRPLPVPVTPEDRKPKGDALEAKRFEVVGFASDPLYRALSKEEQIIRNQKVDRLIQRWLKGVHYRQFEVAERARKELNDDYQSKFGDARADYLVGTPDPDSGYGDGTASPLVPLPLARVIVMHRDSRARLPGLAQRFTSEAQTLRIPEAGKATVEMVAEGSTANQGEPVLGDVLLSKKKMQGKFAASEEALDDSAFNLATFFGVRAGTAMGALMDVQIATSNGVAPNITESFGSATIAEYTEATPGTLTYTDIVNAFFTVEEAYHGDLAFFGDAQMMGFLSTILDGNGRPIFTPGLAAPTVVTDSIGAGATGAIFGRPVYLVPTASGSLFIGNMGEYAYLDGGGIGIRSSEHAGWASDTVQWKVTQRWDGAFTQTNGWIKIAGITTT